MFKIKRDSGYWTKAAIIAAIYAALTLLVSPLSYGLMQVRISEVLVVLCVFAEYAVPGITAGCLIANLLGPNGMLDVVLGTLATFIGCRATYALRRFTYWAPMANVLSNAVIVGAMLRYVLALEESLLVCMLWVGAGELIACMGLGAAVIRFLKSREDIKF